MSVLVTGGAGYIGGHLVRLLGEDGCVVVDDLSTGSRSRIGAAPLVEAELSRDETVELLTSVLVEHDVTAVVHLAARKQVGESVARPAWYYRQNIGGTANVLLAMEAAGVKQLVFSSSAATYGNVDAGGERIAESLPTRPASPYGETKLVSEWNCRAAEEAWGLRWVALRYFNVAGSGYDDLGDPAVLNLIPIALSALTRGEQPKVFGNDYDTPDGTCIRDYIHVQDLVEAHETALGWIASEAYDQTTDRIFNVGTGRGASVLEVLSMIAEVSGLDVRPEIVDRRPGDPDRLVADPELIARHMGWRGRLDLREMVDSAWRAWG
ncbi:UDP-glucose 4-epimerase GalE [Nocardioides agariphilus]|jgi:UDP-glucose 4-epimerase|uniref:UDP-glucose 4-epimerase n=1 Tax=Nocardioides agariphilus TaxID=433664 RepID=A0A930VG48_9ACTN|nr:UDP-glucose 4-epimerase GalE [Nocardioides agariphilus]MBF4766899.1 UDP-glucose 4-epimerase GalE [Nocardioides agariphilus]